MALWVAEQVDRPSYFDRIFSVEEFLEELEVRADNGYGWDRHVAVRSDERPEEVRLVDPRIVWSGDDEESVAAFVVRKHDEGEA